MQVLSSTMAKTLRITVKVVPSSGMRKWALDKSGALKCYLKSPPEDGAANAELIKTLAKALGITQQDVAIVTGATSRTKLLAVRTELSLQEIYKILGLEVQNALF